MIAARHDYATGSLDDGRLSADPIEQFRIWFEEARAFRDADGVGIVEPHAMALASVDDAGHPHVRMVLLREVRDDGFVFFTNLDSAKGRQLERHPHAALCLHWDRLERQVRITGAVTPIAPEESDAYFASRPRESRIAAAASPQSTVIPDRATLESRFEELEVEFRDADEIPRPARWGGLLVRPETVEFWQGRPHRLHDRFLYSRSDGSGGWRIERLAP